MKRKLVAIVICLGLMGMTGCSLEQAELLDEMKQMEEWQYVDVNGTFEVNTKEVDRFISNGEEDEYCTKSTFRGYFNFQDEEVQLIEDVQEDHGEVKNRKYYIKDGYSYREKEGYLSDYYPRQRYDKIDATYIGVPDDESMKRANGVRTLIASLAETMSNSELSLPVSREGESFIIELASEEEMAELIGSLYKAGYGERKEVAKALAEFYIDQGGMHYNENDYYEDDYLNQYYYEKDYFIDQYYYEYQKNRDVLKDKEEDWATYNEEHEQSDADLTREQKIDEVTATLVEGWEKYYSDGEAFEMSKLFLKGNMLGSHAKIKVTPKEKGYLIDMNVAISTIGGSAELKGSIVIQEAEDREIKLPTGSKALSQEENDYYTNGVHYQSFVFVDEKSMDEEALQYVANGVTRDGKRYYNLQALGCEVYEKEGKYYLVPFGGYAYVHLVNGIKQGKVSGKLDGNKPVISCNPMEKTLKDGSKIYFIDENTVKRLNFEIVEQEKRTGYDDYYEESDNKYDRCYVYYELPVKKEERKALYQAYYDYVEAIFAEETSSK